MPRPAQNAAGANTVYSVELTFDEYSAALARLPPPISHYIEFEASVSYNPLEVLQVQAKYGLTWAEILAHLKRDSCETHRRAFGGVHPYLDTAPRRVV